MFKENFLKYKRKKFFKKHIQIVEKYFSFAIPIVDNDGKPKDKLNKKERLQVLNLILESIKILNNNLYFNKLALYNIDYKRKNKNYYLIKNSIFPVYKEINIYDASKKEILANIKIEDISEKRNNKNKIYNNLWNILNFLTDEKLFKNLYQEFIETNNHNNNISMKEFLIIHNLNIFLETDLPDILIKLKKLDFHNKKRNILISQIFEIYFQYLKQSLMEMIGTFEYESDNIIANCMYYNLILFEKLYLNDFLEILKNTNNNILIMTILNIFYLISENKIKLHLLYTNSDIINRYYFPYHQKIDLLTKEQSVIDKFIILLNKLINFEELYIF